MTMATNPLDISDTLLANSAQLNAADIMGGDVTVQIVSAHRHNDDKQPISLKITGGFKPWFPCKTVRRILAEVWGTDASAYVGRWVRLYREPSVVYAGEEVGGVRVNGLSDISGNARISLKERKTGKPSVYVIARIAPKQMELGAFKAACKAAVDSGEWTWEQVKSLCGMPSDNVAPDHRAPIVDRLKSPPDVEDAPPIND
jgi:hypothetical protein